jgi:hypothetical protein
MMLRGDKTRAAAEADGECRTRRALLTSPGWLYGHCCDLALGDRGASFCGSFFRRQARVPMHRKKAPPGQAAGRIRHQPVKRRRHHRRLDHLGAVIAGLERHHTGIGDPPGRLTVTPVPARSFAMIAEKASNAAFDGP